MKPHAQVNHRSSGPRGKKQELSSSCVEDEVVLVFLSTSSSDHQSLSTDHPPSMSRSSTGLSAVLCDAAVGIQRGSCRRRQLVAYLSLVDTSTSTLRTSGSIDLETSSALLDNKAKYCMDGSFPRGRLAPEHSAQIHCVPQNGGCRRSY